MKKSIWEKYIKKLDKSKINENVDVLIIGGGLSGISTAFELKDSSLNISLIESNKIGSGASSLTTGKLTYLQDTIYSDLESMYDINTSKEYLKSQVYALNRIKNIINKYKIDCDYINNDSYIFSLKDEDKIKIDKEYNILKKFGINTEIVNKLPIKFPCSYALKVKDTAVFNPVKYINSLVNLMKDKVNICEHVRALGITKESDHYIVDTTKGKINAKYVVVCTQYPFFVIPSLIPFKTHIEKSHVIASKVDDIKNFNAMSVGKQKYSIRYYKDKDSYIIFAGESYKMSNHINYKKRQEELEIKFKEFFNLDINYRWSTHDITSNDFLPIIGKISDNLLVSTAFNKWGMTNSVLSGKILSDIVLNNENEYISLFNPKRKITIKRTMNFFIDTFNTGKIFISTKLNKNKVFYNNNVKFENINGKSYGIYIDENQNKHIVRNLCPHMKCSLIFNYMDKTWDCPCHGSRYDIDGNIIKGPSTFSIKV